MSPNLTQLIEQSATLSPQEKLELATHLKSSQNSPDLWDLSEDTIAKRNVEMRQILAEWRDMGDEEEQTETWEELKVSLDRDASHPIALSSLLNDCIQVIEYINIRQRSSVLETITNLRSQQTSFKTPEEIDAEILEEKAAWIN